MQVIITINKKPGVLDPEAQAIKQSLFSLGFDDLENVTVGKQITLFIETEDQERAKYRAAKLNATHTVFVFDDGVEIKNMETGEQVKAEIDSYEF